MKNSVKKNGAFGFSVKVRKDQPEKVQSGRVIRIMGGDDEGGGGQGRVTSVEFL